MKKSLLISAIAVFGLTSSAFSATSSDAGVYMGLQGGLSLSNLQDIQGIIKNGYKIIDAQGDHGFVSRVFIGYDINRYFAVESGYSYFFNESCVNRVEIYTTKQNVISQPDGGNSMVVDLYGKGKLPLIKNFDLYAKLGANLFMARVEGSGNNRNNVNMSFGAGTDYRITSNFIANFEWLRINGNARISNIHYQPNADLFLLGLRYKFDL